VSVSANPGAPPSKVAVMWLVAAAAPCPYRDGLRQRPRWRMQFVGAARVWQRLAACGPHLFSDSQACAPVLACVWLGLLLTASSSRSLGLVPLSATAQPVRTRILVGLSAQNHTVVTPKPHERFLHVLSCRTPHSLPLPLNVAGRFLGRCWTPALSHQTFPYSPCPQAAPQHPSCDSSLSFLRRTS
jgi:hypothetical protein